MKKTLVFLLFFTALYGDDIRQQEDESKRESNRLEDLRVEQKYLNDKLEDERLERKRLDDERTLRKIQDDEWNRAHNRM